MCSASSSHTLLHGGEQWAGPRGCTHWCQCSPSTTLWAYPGPESKVLSQDLHSLLPQIHSPQTLSECEALCSQLFAVCVCVCVCVCRLEVGTRLSSSIFTKLSLCRMEPRWERKGAVGCGLWLASPRCGVPSSTPRSPGTLNADPAFQVTILY